MSECQPTEDSLSTPSLVPLALSYRDLGWTVLPILPGNKRPVGKNWQDYRPDEAMIEHAFRAAGSIGIHLGPSGLIDVDLDCPTAIALAPHYLPEGGSAFGRLDSQYAGHYLYAVTEGETPVYVKYNVGRTTLLELRCGDGLQTVFPGSTHPSGQRIEWLNRPEWVAPIGVAPSEGPMPIAYDELRFRTNLLAAATALVVYSNLTIDEAIDLLDQSDPVIPESPARAKILEWLGMTPTPAVKSTTNVTPAPRPAGNGGNVSADFRQASNAFLAANPLTFPATNSPCPVCGHPSFKATPDGLRWTCRGSDHAATNVGTFVPNHTLNIGDALDLAAHRAGTTTRAFLITEGYLVTTPTPTPATLPTNEADPFADIYIVGIGTSSTAYYLRKDNGKWMLSPKDDLLTNIAKHQPAIDLFKVSDDKDGNPKVSRRTLNEIKDAHHLTCKELVYDFMLDTSTIRQDEDGDYTFRLASAPRATVTPEYSPRVDHWMKLLCGDQYDKVCDWVATIKRLDRPSAALYMHGPRRSGKSLFAKIASGLWRGRAATDYSVVFERFNDYITRCPLVLLDEGLPRTGATHVEEFRSRITSTSMTIEQKNGPRGHVDGALRFIITANHEDALRLPFESSGSGDAALAERILFVDAPLSDKQDPGTDSYEALASLYLDDLGGIEVVQRWIEEEDGTPGEAVRHFEWLVQHREVVPASRLWVEGAPGDWTRRAATSNSAPAATLLSAIVRWLPNQTKYGTCGLTTRKYKGEVCVMIDDFDAFYSKLSELTLSRKDPAAETTVRKALRAVCQSGKAIAIKVEGRVIDRYLISGTTLLEHANKNGADIDAVRTALGMAPVEREESAD